MNSTIQNALKILLVEDSMDDVTLIERELGKADFPFTLHLVRKKDEFEAALVEFGPDVILADHALPEFNSIEAFKLYQAHADRSGQSIPFILVTGNVSEDFAMESLRSGVDDYILKTSLKRLPSAITGAIEKCRIGNERKKYFDQVLAKQAVMNEAEQLAHFGSWQVDIATGKHTWSDEAYRMYGFAPGEVELSNEMFLSMVHPDDVSTIMAAHDIAVGHQGSAEFEFRIRDRKGKLKYMGCKLVVHFDAEGKPARLLGFNLDITARKLAEEAMGRKTQEYQALFDRHPDAVFALDREGRFKRVNEKVAQLIGKPADELSGVDFRKFIFEENLREVGERFLAALDKASQRFTTTFVLRGGRRVDLEVTFIPIVVNEEVTGVHGVARDVTGGLAVKSRKAGKVATRRGRPR